MTVGFVHTLTLVHTPLDSGDLDEYGQPSPGTTTTTTLKGLVQPRSVQEQVDTRSAGVDIGSHVIFLPLMDLGSADHFVYDDDRYEIKGIRPYEFGRRPHLEVDVQRVGGVVADA